MEALTNDFEKAQYLQNLLVNRATGGVADNAEYQLLRQHLLSNQTTNALLPSWIRTNRDLSQFWQFIKLKFSTYTERRSFIRDEFSALLDFLEPGTKIPNDLSVSDGLMRLNSASVQMEWTKALTRRQTDPGGAITTAKTLLETTCKHILDERHIDYSKATDLPQLYRLVSLELSLSPGQHTEDVFKQILGGCSSVINGLCTLRNRFGDAHGQGKKTVRPAPRHAELAVNLAGSMALF